MARSKKASAAKNVTRSKNKMPNGRISDNKPENNGKNFKQAKPNLQPARIIKKPEPVASTLTEASTSSEDVLEALPPRVVASPDVLHTQPQEVRSDTPVPATSDIPVSVPPSATSPEASEAAEVIKAQPLGATVSSSELEKKTQAVRLPPSVIKLHRRRALTRTLLACVVIIGFVAAGTIAYSRTSRNAVAQNAGLIKAVSQRAVVPLDETPAVSTVVDETQVNQEFLRGTKSGDKVLLYFQAGRAIVYRPSEEKIINMGPIETPKPRVFLRNGSSSAYVEQVASRMGQIPDFLVVSRDDATKKSYSKTVVIDVTGNRPDVAARLAGHLGAAVGVLPDGESRPDADLLVIVGSDRAKP